VTKYIIDHDLHDKAFIEEWVEDFDEYYKSLEIAVLESLPMSCCVIPIAQQMTTDSALAHSSANLINSASGIPVSGLKILMNITSH
jgi:formate dehydrogenase major subunit